MISPIKSMVSQDGSRITREIRSPFFPAAQCEKWDAQWIWSEESRAKSLPAIYARKTFSIETLPVSAVIHISAHQGFRLFVNGQFVGDGPARNAVPNCFTYNSYDVATILQRGINTIVITASFFPPELPGAQMQETFRHDAGLIAQMDIRNSSGVMTERIATDKSWRVCCAPWERTRSFSAGNDWTEVFDATREPFLKHTADFDDSDWEQALILPNDGRMLEPSIIPHYQRTERLPAKIELEGEILEILGDTRLSVGIQMTTEIPRPVRHCRISNAAGLLEKDLGPAIIENPFPVNDLKSFYTYWDSHDDAPFVRCATLIIDFGELMNAFIQLDVEGNSGASVDIAWGQTLIEGRVLPLLYSRLAADPAGRPSRLHANRYILREGRQAWETFHWQNFRYLQLTFRHLVAPLKIHRIAAIQSEQPLVSRGDFRGSDPFLQKLTASTVKTLRLTSYDTFMDNTIREKTIWGGEVAEGAIASCLASFGDVPILRQYINLFCRTQQPDGALVQHVKEGQLKCKIVPHALRLALAMLEYALWCENVEQYRLDVLPVSMRYINYLAARANEQGLLALRETESGWVDHVTGAAHADVPLPTNLLYLILLEKAARIFAAYGELKPAAAAEQQANLLRASIERDFWDAARGMYIDGTLMGKPCGSYSEQSNYLALYCRLDQTGRREKILNALRDPKQVGEIIQSGPLFMFWPPAALFAIGEGKPALNMIRERYGRYYKGDNDTFWEEWSWLIAANAWKSRYRSLAQNCGSPAWFFLTEILGVKPLKPRFAEFQIAPNPSGLNWAEGVIPSPAGDIPVNWEISDNFMTLKFIVPDNTQAHVRLPAQANVIEMDGRTERTEAITADAGEHVIKANWTGHP